MNPRTLLARLALAALVLTPAAARAQTPPAAPPESAQATEEGKAHFTRGVALFHEGDFRSALVEFRRAYELSRNHRVLYNIGQTELQVQDYAAAQRTLQKYLGEGGAEIDAARRAAVEDDLKKLVSRVARIDLKSNAVGAEVLVDDVLVGKTPLKEPVLVSMGRRKVVVQKSGLPPVVRYVDLAGGDLVAVSLEVAEAAPGAATPPLPTPAPPPPVVVAPPPSRTGLWVSLAVTGALAAGTVVTGVLALGAHGDAETKLGMLGVKAADVEAAHAKTARLALVTDILGGAAIAMTGVTIIVGVTGGRSEAGKPAGAARLTLTPRGAALGGTF
jgi:tetratricopeptide (TPR) repeat protein